jgi:hypothetical protein
MSAAAQVQALAADYNLPEAHPGAATERSAAPAIFSPSFFAGAPCFVTAPRHVAGFN